MSEKWKGTKSIASGSCASVVKQCQAIKTFHSHTSLYKQRKEAAMMLLVQGSEFFPQVYSVECNKGGQLTISMELFEDSLTHQLNKYPTSLGTSASIQKCMWHVFSALRHLHLLGIMHADVKPCNILVSPDMKRFVLTDFSHAHWLGQGDPDKRQRYKHPVSNIEYSAPEILRVPRPKSSSSSSSNEDDKNDKDDDDKDDDKEEEDEEDEDGKVFVWCNSKIDIYAAGLVMLDLMQVVNWHTIHDHNDRERNTNVLALVSEKKEAIIEKVGPLGHELLLHLLDDNSNSRYTAQRALRHPYFSSEIPLYPSSLQPLENFSLIPSEPGGHFSQVKDQIMPKVQILSKHVCDDPKVIHLIMDYDVTYSMDQLITLATIRKQMDLIRTAGSKADKVNLSTQLFMFLIFVDTPLMSSGTYNDFYSTTHAKVNEFLEEGNFEHIKKWMHYLLQRLEALLL